MTLYIVSPNNLLEDLAMKPYLLFGGRVENPGGGWDDFIEDFSTLDDALSSGAIIKDKGFWYHIIDDQGRICLEIDNSTKSQLYPYDENFPWSGYFDWLKLWFIPNLMHVDGQLHKYWVGACPFQDCDDSIHINPSMNIYKCFGCGRAGQAEGLGATLYKTDPI